MFFNGKSIFETLENIKTDDIIFSHRIYNLSVIKQNIVGYAHGIIFRGVIGRDNDVISDATNDVIQI